MKNRIITFLLSMGIPLSAVNNNCNGTCGSCQLTCYPSIFLICILLLKSFCKFIKQKKVVHYE